MSDEPRAITITIRALLDHSLWVDACRITGMNEWAVNEGMADEQDTVALTAGQAHELGLLPRRAVWPGTSCCPVRNDDE